MEEDYGPECGENRRPPRAETTEWVRPPQDAPVTNPPAKGGMVAEINCRPFRSALITALIFSIGVIIAMESMYGALR